MKRTIKLRAQEPDAPERKVRLRLPGRLAAELDEYRDLYFETHRHEIDLAALIEGILEQFLASDRFFQRRQRQSRPPGALSSGNAKTLELPARARVYEASHEAG